MSFTETVQVLDDDTVENRERFFVGLSAPAGETALNLPEDASVVYIADNDSELTMYILLTLFEICVRATFSKTSFANDV